MAVDAVHPGFRHPNCNHHRHHLDNALDRHRSLYFPYPSRKRAAMVVVQSRSFCKGDDANLAAKVVFAPRRCHPAAF